MEVNMPNGVIPSGYSARLLGSATTYEGLNFYSALEESSNEGSLMLMQLDFEDFPTSAEIEGLNQALLNAGVPVWPGNTRIVYSDISKPTIYLEWVKGIAWMPIIIGILLVTVLPVLLGGIIWLILPKGIKEMIELAGMMAIMFGIMSFIPKLTSEKKEKKVEKEKK
jgi:hypothetical protein